MSAAVREVQVQAVAPLPPSTPLTTRGRPPLVWTVSRGRELQAPDHAVPAWCRCAVRGCVTRNGIGMVLCTDVRVLAPPARYLPQHLSPDPTRDSHGLGCVRWAAFATSPGPACSTLVGPHILLLWVYVVDTYSGAWGACNAPLPSLHLRALGAAISAPTSPCQWWGHFFQRAASSLAHPAIHLVWQLQQDVQVALDGACVLAS